MCVLRNLSYQLYGEIPPSALMRLEGPTRSQASGKGEAIGCFTPQSRKAKNVCRREIYPSAFCHRGADCSSQRCPLLSFFSWQSKNQDLSTFTEVARVPKGMEWLWHPEIVRVYSNVLRQCEINSTTREAAAGVLQNITAGDMRVSNLLVISPVKSFNIQMYRIWSSSLSPHPAVGVCSEPGGSGAGAYSAGAAGQPANQQWSGAAFAHRPSPKFVPPLHK